jgi:hypothetical protein
MYHDRLVQGEKKLPVIMLFHKARHFLADERMKPSRREKEKPLACIIFFFASQMTCNLKSENSVAGEPEARHHQLDTLLAQVREHANQSPYVTRFEAIPVEMAPPGRPRGTSSQEMHDTLLLASFKSKNAWYQWIRTSEWQHFMQETADKGVFRRIPHVRCAHSLQGLRNPIEVLMA